MDPLTLYIGNQNYSSWSLRPWIALKHSGVPFTHRVIALDVPETAVEIAKVTPAGRVPVLHHGALRVWDSLAICEYVNELFPQARLWPSEPTARAHARAISAEMHAGFPAMREHLTMRFRDTVRLGPLPPEAEANIERVRSMWSELRGRYAKEGPFLFGHFTIADAMYAPVVSRFHTYGVPLEGAARAYHQTMWNLPAMQEWLSAAKSETLRMRRYELPSGA